MNVYEAKDGNIKRLWTAFLSGKANAVEAAAVTHSPPDAGLAFEHVVGRLPGVPAHFW